MRQRKISRLLQLVFYFIISYFITSYFLVQQIFVTVDVMKTIKQDTVV